MTDRPCFGAQIESRVDPSSHDQVMPQPQIRTWPRGVHVIFRSRLVNFSISRRSGDLDLQPPVKRRRRYLPLLIELAEWSGSTHGSGLLGTLGCRGTLSHAGPLVTAK